MFSYHQRVCSQFDSSNEVHHHGQYRSGYSPSPHMDQQLERREGWEVREMEVRNQMSICGQVKPCTDSAVLHAVAPALNVMFKSLKIWFPKCVHSREVPL